ncbi:MAG: hypothetical protein P4L79_17770 [Legionella sp.]|uniref:ankyrin repeat domain-containing protein n=1 Tax=Legionella sp. TaxID=459 RepID=UPI00284028A8|nr:hypothetical protein [Legionella sp.]
MNPKYLSDKDLTNALWHAIGDRLEQRAIILLTSDLSTGLDLTFRDEQGKSFLMYALEMGCHKVAHTLLQTARREDALTWLNVDNQGKNIYHYAAKYNEIELLDELNEFIQSAAQAEKLTWRSVDYLGNSPFHVASQCMQLDTIKWFIAHTEDPMQITQMVCQANHERITPLHLAMVTHVELDKPETVAFLMQHGAHVLLREYMAILLNWSDQSQFSLWAYLRKIKQDVLGEETAAYYLLKQVKSYLEKKGFNEIKEERRASFLVQASSLPHELLEKTSWPLRFSPNVATVRDHYYSNQAMMTDEIIAYEQAVKYDEDDIEQLKQDLNNLSNSFLFSRDDLIVCLMLASYPLACIPAFLFLRRDPLVLSSILSQIGLAAWLPAAWTFIGLIPIGELVSRIAPDPQKIMFIHPDEWQPLIDEKAKPILKSLQKLALEDPAHLPISLEEMDKFKADVEFFDQRKLSVSQVKQSVTELTDKLTRLGQCVHARRLSFTFYGQKLSARPNSDTDNEEAKPSVPL